MLFSILSMLSAVGIGVESRIRVVITGVNFNVRIGVLYGVSAIVILIEQVGLSEYVGAYEDEISGVIFGVLIGDSCGVSLRVIVGENVGVSLAVCIGVFIGDSLGVNLGAKWCS